MFSTLLKNRGFILTSVKREFQIRYRTSMLGALWLVIQPLAMILVYTLIFSQIMHTKLPGLSSVYAYSIYLCSGTLAWTFFSETITRCQNMFIDNANILKKLNFPRICIPTIVALSSGMNFFIIFSLFVIFLIFSGNFPGWSFFLIIPLLLLQLLFSLGLGLTLGVLNVFFKDVGQMTGIVLQFWFWFTPIVYPASIVPQWAQPYIRLNPMTGLVSSYQTILTNQQAPEYSQLMLPLGSTIFFCALGWYLFRKHSADMIDEL